MVGDTFNPGARVLLPDGTVFGAVSAGESSDSNDAALLVMHENQLVRIPRNLVDTSQSTPDTVVLSAMVELPPAAGEGSGSTIELHAEDLNIDVTEKERGRVRIQKSVEHVPVREDVELGTDVVEIERVASGEEHDEPPESWQDGDTLVVPVVEEILVLTRRYRVVENVRITKRREVRTERIETDLRREVLNVEYDDTESDPTDS